MKQSVEISNTTTLLQRVHLILFDGVNRRALSECFREYNHMPDEQELIICALLSRRVRYAGLPAAVRLQHAHVLQRDALQGDWLQPADSRRPDRVWHELHLHAVRVEVHRHYWPAQDHALLSARHGRRPHAGQHLLLL